MAQLASRESAESALLAQTGVSEPPCRIPCLILCLADVAHVCQCRAPNPQAAPARSRDRYSWGKDRAALKRW